MAQMKGSPFDGVTVPCTAQKVVPVMSIVNVFEDWETFPVLKETIVASEFTKKFSVLQVKKLLQRQLIRVQSFSTALLKSLMQRVEKKSSQAKIHSSFQIHTASRLTLQLKSVRKRALRLTLTVLRSL
jgi:hypothetical protein